MKTKKISSNISITIICILLGLALSWQFQSIRNNASVMNLENQKKDDLVVKILNEQKNNENLKAKLNELQIQINKFEDASGNSDENMKLLSDEIKKLKQKLNGDRYNDEEFYEDMKEEYFYLTDAKINLK